jgi:hypothetical protein
MPPYLTPDKIPISGLSSANQREKSQLAIVGDFEVIVITISFLSGRTLGARFCRECDRIDLTHAPGALR